VYGSRRLSIFLLLTFVLFASLASAIYADIPQSVSEFAAKGFPDNVDLRGRLFSYVIGASRDVALAYGEKQLQSSAAGPVTVRVEKRSADFLVEFLNANSAVADAPGRGSCFIQRSLAKGNYILQARILLEDDPSCFLALYPSGSGTRGDVVMYGAVVKKGLYFSDLIYRILLLSFSDIVDASARSFDWGLVFRFEKKASESVAELRSSDVARAAAEQPTSCQGSQPASASSSKAAVANAKSPKTLLAAAPALPVQPASETLPKGPRSLRVAAAVDKSSSVEAIILDLGDLQAREIAPSADALSGYVDSSDPVGKLAYGDFPRYDSRGLPLAAARAILYSDFLANRGSIYALSGESFRATVVPYFDDAGRLAFAFFSGGKELSWEDLSAGKRDLKVRAVRVPAES
jgi:hypothetical protein